MLTLWYDGPPDQLQALRTVAAVYAADAFSGTRPTALLGDASFRRLLRLIRLVRPTIAGAQTLRLSAAGASTTPLTRLTAALCDVLGLTPTTGAADVLIRLRRPPDGAPGWQVLARLGRRPLSVRPWRICDMPGALNATVAAAMVELAGAAPGHRFLNVACGSGTLCIERLQSGTAATVVGVDVDALALSCAGQNLSAAGCAHAVSLVESDAASLPFAAGVFDVIVSDLPFGMSVGSPRGNQALYPAVLAEAGRVAANGARLVAITTARRLFESAARSVPQWTVADRVPVRLPTRSGIIRPCIYLCRRA